MKNEFKRIISMLLCAVMLLGVVPVSALAAEPSGPVLDSGVEDVTIGQSGTEEAPAEEAEVSEDAAAGAEEETGDGPMHWLQQYQAAALAQMERPAAYSLSRAASEPASPSYSSITWSGGQLEFANGAYLGSPLPKIYLNGEIAFCGEWNGEVPSGSYIQSGEGNNSTIKQILANYDASGQGNADYAAAQVAIWAELMGTSVSSWGGCPSEDSWDEIANGDADYDHLRYNYISWTGGTQNLIQYNLEKDPEIPVKPPTEEEYPEDEYEKPRPRRKPRCTTASPIPTRTP